MTAGTLLLRQVHPQWLKPDGSLASIAFWPFPKDDGLLSVDDGSKVTAEDAWRSFNARPKCTSVEVWAVTVQEAAALALPCRADPTPANPNHAVIDFTAHPEKLQKAKSKLLKAHARARGCQFRARV